MGYADKIMDHVKYPKFLRTRTVAELKYTIKDAQEAMAANPQNPNNGFYADEIHYAAAELRRRETPSKPRRLSKAEVAQDLEIMNAALGD